MNRDILKYVVELTKMLGCQITEPTSKVVTDLITLYGLVPASEPCDSNQSTAYIKLMTYADGRPAPAQVKAFTNYRAIGDTYEVTPDGVVDFIRFQTDESGEGLFPLPAGRKYLLKIDKGITYGVSYALVDAKADETLDVSVNMPLLVDLKSKGIYVGELHHHSVYSSPSYGGTDDVTDSTQDVKIAMMAGGLDYGALSDHHNTLNHDEWRAMSDNRFTTIVSKEISTSCGHVAAHGAKTDVIFRIPEADERTDEYLKNEFIRITTEIKSTGGIAQLNHPCAPQKAIAFPPNFLDIVDIFDTFEIWNGHLPFIKGLPNDHAFRLWLSLLRKGLRLTAVCGSDTHRIIANDYNALTTELSRLCEGLNKIVIPDSLNQAALVLKGARELLIPAFEEWNEHAFGTGSVANMTFVDGEPSEANILESLKKGHNVLTNGPILVPSIDRKYPGETVSASEGSISLNIELLAKKELETIVVYTMAGEQAHAVKPCSKDGEFYNFSTSINVNLQLKDFVVVAAYGGPANLAIANPIYIESGA